MFLAALALGLRRADGHPIIGHYASGKAPAINRDDMRNADLT
jgi:hypothetical protein